MGEAIGRYGGRGPRIVPHIFTELSNMGKCSFTFAYLSNDGFPIKIEKMPFFSTIFVAYFSHFSLILIVQNYVDVGRLTKVQAKETLK